jgi:hypothetical protein
MARAPPLCVPSPGAGWNAGLPNMAKGIRSHKTAEVGVAALG